ncbi:MAG: glycosyltransferase [Lachnospiraceae bacterium]|nr:glycosyltransferase [Lachnospiraceae bacterium]
MIQRPTFSIIIPVYNAETFLSEAVCSVLGQTFADLELVLVDDCSTDGSAALAASFCCQDPRVWLIRMPENGGAAAARNAGIEEARGRYVMFLDSDDVYEEGLLEAVSAQLAHDPDVVLWGLVEEYQENDGSVGRRVEILPETKDGAPAFLADREALRPRMLQLEQQSLYGYLWNKAYRAELIGDHRIPKQAFNEDEMFNIRLFDDVNSLVLLPLAGTRYRIRSGSLTHRELPEYYPIAMRRVAALTKQQMAWGTYGEEARKTLAGQYVRYIASALERNTHKAMNMSGKDRRRFLDRVFGSDLYRELIPAAAPESRALAVLAKALKKKNKAACLAIGRATAVVKRRMTGAFYRAKNG